MEDAETREMSALVAASRSLNIALGNPMHYECYIHVAGFGIGIYTGLTHLFINATVRGVLYGGGALMQRSVFSHSHRDPAVFFARTIAL